MRSAGSLMVLFNNERMGIETIFFGVNIWPTSVLAVVSHIQAKGTHSAGEKI